MTKEIKHTVWYVAAPDTIRGQEPRIRNTMPAVRDNNTGKEVCVLTNYNREHANLIAAAPELLEELKAKLSWMIDYVPPETAGYAAELANLETAIAKGEES